MIGYRFLNKLVLLKDIRIKINLKQIIMWYVKYFIIIPMLLMWAKPRGN